MKLVVTSAISRPMKKMVVFIMTGSEDSTYYLVTTKNEGATT